jgi:hypothetical protein
MKLLSGGITMRKMKPPKQIAKERANCKKKQEKKQEVKTGMTNQNIKTVQKAAREHERQRWAKKLRKQAGEWQGHWNHVLLSMAERMETNKNFDKEM